jgi:hypothetical protein
MQMAVAIALPFVRHSLVRMLMAVIVPRSFKLRMELEYAEKGAAAEAKCKSNSSHDVGWFRFMFVDCNS